MITVNRADVKRKLRLLGTEYDAEIDALIADMVPAIRYAIDPHYLENPDPDLVSTLNLGALELVAGEMSATLWREVGAWVGFRLGWLQVIPPTPPVPNPSDPSGLKAQGYLRLAPYLKRNARLQFVARPPKTGEDS